MKSENNNLTKRKRADAPEPDSKRPKLDDETFMREILDEIQRSSTSHVQNKNKILTRYENKKDIHINWKEPLSKFMLRLKTDEPVKNIEKFIVSMCTTPGAESLLYAFLRWILSMINSRDKAVRLRTCRLVHLIIEAMDDDAEIDDNIFRHLEDKLQQRLNDRDSRIRKAAIQASNRLQDKDDVESCRLIKGLLNRLQYDKDKECRKEALKIIDLNRVTLPHIIDRTRDEEPVIRKEAFSILSRIDINALSIENRVTVLVNGLMDRDESVKNAAMKMIEKRWLSSKNVEWDLLTLLRKLDVELNYSDLDEPLFAIFDKWMNKFDRQHFPPYSTEDLSVLPSQSNEASEEENHEMMEDVRVAVFLWRLLVAWRERNDADVNEINELISDVNVEDFCKALEMHKNDKFIAHQLLKLSTHLDFSDEFGRNKLVGFARELLKDDDIDDIVIPDLMAVLRKLYKDDEKTFARIIREDLEEFRDRLEQEGKEELSVEERDEMNETILKLEKKLKKVDDKYHKKLDERNPEEAVELSNLKKTINEEITHLDLKVNKMVYFRKNIYFRQIVIIKDFFQHTTLPPDDSYVVSMHEEITMGISRDGDCFGHFDMRQAFLEAVGTFCMLSKENVLKYFWIFKMLTKDDPEVRPMTIKCVLDFLYQYTFTDVELINAKNLLDIDENDEPRRLNLSNRKLITWIMPFMDQNNPEWNFYDQVACIEGFTKLLMNNRLVHCQKEIISQMLLTYHMPVDRSGLIDAEEYDDLDDIDRRNQLLSLFFSNYYSRPLNVMRNAKQLLVRILPEVIMLIVAAPRQSSEKNINREKLIDYIIWLIEIGENPSEGENSKQFLHCQLAYLCLSHMNKQKEVVLEAQRSLCYALSKLDIAGTTKDLTRCEDLITQVTVNIVDKTSRKTWEKFKANMTSAIKAAAKQSEAPASAAALSESILVELAAEAENTQQHHQQRRQSMGRRRSLSEELIKSPKPNAKKRKLQNRRLASEEILKSQKKIMVEAKQKEDIPPAKRKLEEQLAGRKRVSITLTEDEDDEEIDALLNE